MGIQGFFNYFFGESESLKPNKKFIIEENVDESVTRIYVDFVNIVHDILAESKILKRLQKIFSHYPNSKKLIFFECIPTVAKIKEQYARRIFKKIQMDIEIDISGLLDCKIETKFDHQKFAIDSSFIKELSKSIKNEFSDAEVFGYTDNDIGEAEHKIISHIKNNPFEHDDVFVIYSPDADVFLLATIMTNLLNSDTKNITINAMRRSDDVSNRIFYKIDTKKYMNYLLNAINGYKKNKKNVINDITYIFNLLGDDFVPIFDKFKTYNAKNIFSIIFDALKTLDDNEYVLVNNGNNYVIKKKNLLKIFTYINTTSSEKQKIRQYRYIAQYDKMDGILNNKLVLNVLLDGFNKGYYFYERECDCNDNNFNIDKKNATKKFTNTLSQFLVYEKDKKNKQYIITVNKSNYKTVSLINIDNEQIVSTNSSKNDDIIKNYFEGYEFILDLYYNTPGTVKNNFWFYRYNESPKIEKTIEWLEANKLPTYVINNNELPTYFNGSQYKKYLAELIDSNYMRLLKNGELKIKYNDLLEKKKNTNLIFNCFEKKYINKCDIKNEIFIEPIRFLNKLNKKND